MVTLHVFIVLFCSGFNIRPQAERQQQQHPLGPHGRQDGPQVEEEEEKEEKLLLLLLLKCKIN